MNKRIPFSGIIRNTSDSTAELGTCQEIINLRPIGKGSYRMVLPAQDSMIIASGDRIFIHKGANFTNRLKYNAGSGVLALFDPTKAVADPGHIIQTIDTISEKPASISIAQVHNFMMYTYEVNGAVTTKKALFDGTTYKKFDNNMPQLPLIKFTTRMSVDKETTLAASYPDDLSFPRDMELVKTAIDGTVAKEINDANRTGAFEGYVMINYALKLYDGTYVGHTMPIVIRAGYDPVSMKVRSLYYIKDAKKATQLYIKNFQAGTLQFKVVAGSFPDMASFKDMVKSVDIFMTTPRSAYSSSAMIYKAIPSALQAAFAQKGIQSAVDNAASNMNYANNEMPSINDKSWVYGSPFGTSGLDVSLSFDDTNTVTDPSEFTVYKVTPESLVDSQSVFFKIKSINIEDLGNYSSFTDISVDLSGIELFEKLTYDQNSHHKIHGRILGAFNDRFLLANIQTELFKGFSPDYFTPDQGTTYTIKTVIKTDKGERVVQSDAGGTGFSFGRLIGYPDARATKMIFSNGKAVDLRPHPILNFAYYAQSDMSEIITMNNYATVHTVNNRYDEMNRIQASSFQNALFFPVKNSYSVGVGEIRSLAINSSPMHAAEFGTFPVYALTSKGIWTLQAGTDILFTNIIHTSELVTTSSEVAHVGGGIVFATEKTIAILQGREVIEIGEELKQYSWNKLLNNGGNADYNTIINHASLVQLTSSITNTAFEYYLSGCKIGYMPGMNEIILTNTSYSYSYVYSLKFKQWFKISKVYDYFIYDYPQIYGVNSNGVFNLQLDGWADEDVMIQTRAIKLEEAGITKIKRLLLNIHALKVGNSGKYAGLYVFGSNDLINWKLIDGTQQSGTTYENMVIGELHATFKYYIFIFAATLGNFASTNINYIDVDYEVLYNNKLR